MSFSHWVYTKEYHHISAGDILLEPEFLHGLFLGANITKKITFGVILGKRFKLGIEYTYAVYLRNNLNQDVMLGTVVTSTEPCAEDLYRYVKDYRKTNASHYHNVVSRLLTEGNKDEYSL